MCCRSVASRLRPGLMRHSRTESPIRSARASACWWRTCARSGPSSIGTMGCCSAVSSWPARARTRRPDGWQPCLASGQSTRRRWSRQWATRAHSVGRAIWRRGWAWCRGRQRRAAGRMCSGTQDSYHIASARNATEHPHVAGHSRSGISKHDGRHRALRQARSWSISAAVSRRVNSSPRIILVRRPRPNGAACRPLCSV